MNQERITLINKIFVSIVLLATFFYISLVASPILWFQKVQPPFLTTTAFFLDFLKFPGGFAEWLSNLFTQLFYYKIGGVLIFFLLNVLLYYLTYSLLQRFQKGRLNILLSILPLLLTATQASSYQFSYSIVFSMVLLIIALFPLFRIRNQIYFLIYFLLSAIFIFYSSGSGFLWVYSISALITVLKQNNSIKWLNLGYILLIAYLIIWISISFIFDSVNQFGYFSFISLKNGIEFSTNLLLYAYVFSIPVLLGGIALYHRVKSRNTEEKVSVVLSCLLTILFLAIGAVSHFYSFDPEIRKEVKSEYYRYQNNPEKCREAAMSTKNYSFFSNINYNLSILQSGTFTRDFFNFFQVSGTDALYPDFRLKDIQLLAAVDFYYEIGDIQEAKYWAVELLKNHPYDSRLLKKMVKIELITGNYLEAQKYLNVLDKQFFTTKFVKKYTSYTNDTISINDDVEIIQKRTSVTRFTTVPKTPLLRFQQLVNTNPDNKIAFECLMLYYLLDGNLDGFIEHYNEVYDYFDEPVKIYEEAVLLYGANNSISVANDYNISQTSINSFKRFADELKKREDNDRLAMNEMYSEFGKTYFYYFYFVIPQLLKPEYAIEKAPVNE